MKVENQNQTVPVAPDAHLSEAEKEGMQKVSKSFEALLVNQMIGEMRKTVGSGGLIQESHAEKVFKSMLDSEYSQKISQTGELGLSKMIYDHLLQKYRGG